MADAATALAPIRALHPLDGRYHSGPGIALGSVPARTLIALHLSEPAFEPVGRALGFDLPRRPKASTATDGIAALWLGPDDVMLVSEATGDDAAAELIAKIEASGTAEQSPVDVSDRFVAISLEGPAAEAVLAAGCPRDLRLATFPVGAVTRTVFSRAEITVWRRGETHFEVFCGRSFADYLWEYFVDASRSPAV
ncbi:sarcosine oxidase subunit gamma [Aureimonas leprariae]|uniref:Sarcosine oxidase subunit gamma n=1 Tax=Plantimonas leprariae TaxID=2615207 RepID=A0A7V7TWW0_9HYPH|nr:sarcosine oxidase subunit gamma family protein [Aureimonas leprariae]KAB0680005.1 sarcosine oxidase subunit gamma [Aureimonas leprariae]